MYDLLHKHPSTTSIPTTCICSLVYKSSTYNKVCSHQLILLNIILHMTYRIIHIISYVKNTIAISSTSRSAWSKYHHLGTSASISICKYPPIIIYVRTHHHHVSNNATLSNHSCTQHYVSWSQDHLSRLLDIINNNPHPHEHKEL